MTRDHLFAELKRLRAVLEEAARNPSTEDAHYDGDDVLTRALKAVADHEPDALVKAELQGLADRFDEVSRFWWYS